MGNIGDQADDGGLLAAAQALAPVIRARRDEIERERRLPTDLVEQMRRAQLFQLLLPKALGGPEVSPRILVAVVKELARADGSAGWCAGIASAFGLLAPYLPEPAAQEIFGAGHIVPGTTNPMLGKAAPVPGGFQLSGRWTWCSAVGFCDWMVLAAMVHDGEQMHRGPTGAPDARILMVPQGAGTITDTWHVSGMRGTGSHDFSVTDLFVPDARVLPAFFTPVDTGPLLYRIPFISLFATSLAAVTLGIARAAIDALVEIAAVKTPMASPVLLRERPQAQANIGRAEALLGAAEAFLLAALDALWDEAAAARQPSLAQRAHLRAATTFAAEAGARAVDLVHEAAGGSAVHENGPIARCFRDVHAATQHIGLASNTYEVIGRVLLGLEPGVPRF